MNSGLIIWLEFAALLPLAGAAMVSRVVETDRARRMALAASAASLMCALAASILFFYRQPAGHEPIHLGSALFGRAVLALDELSAPLVPLAALIHFLTILATVRSYSRKFSFAWALVSQSLVLLTLSCQEPWGVIGLLIAGTVPPYMELRSRGVPARAYVIHMALFAALMILGEALVESEGRERTHTLWPVVPLVIAVLIRVGIAPFHVWITELFERSLLGTALLFVTPLIGAYAAVRLVLPIAADEVLRGLGMLSLATAVYAAGMGLIQRDSRRYFCYFFLSQSALVLVGLETCQETGLSGGLLAWLASSLAMTGFGLTLRLLEARHGRLPLTGFKGLYENTPLLGISFLVTGMTAVGFPGTVGFLGMDLLVDGAVHTYPHAGVTVVLAATMNSISIVRAYFRLFTGCRPLATVPLKANIRERVVVYTLIALVLGGGLYPQPGAWSRHHAAKEILNERLLLAPTPADDF
ncbi:MAG: proton-conducting transporter membrane subunit [Pirellulales bacterium]